MSCEDGGVGMKSAIVVAAARTVLNLVGEENDDYVSVLRDGKASPRENMQWRIATEAACAALDLMEEMRNGGK